MASQPGPLLRRLEAYFEGPASVRHAMRIIVVATIATTFLGAALVRLFDHGDFHTFGDALWWALQTVTTVGYGDITPKNGVGRVIGGLFLLYAVAFLTILTAAITTSFIERARRHRASRDEANSATLEAVLQRLDEIVERLERLEQR